MAVDTYLCVAFGYEEESEVWATTITTESLLGLGQAANINVVSENGETFTVETEIIHVGETDEGNNYAVAVSDLVIEDDDFREVLVYSDWMQLEGEDATEVNLIVDTAPPVAGLHDLLLIVGDYTKTDEFGYPNEIQVWHRVIEPSDVSVPLFGERFLSHVVLSNGEITPEIEEYVLEEGADITEILTGEVEIEDAPTVDENSENEDAPTIYYVEDTYVDLEQEGTPEKGYPVLTFYTAKTGYGVASIGVWCPEIAPYTEFDLIADGWEQLGPELFNAVEFRLKERIDLALQTRLVLYYDEYDNRFISEYALQNPEVVKEEQFDLIPLSLQDFVNDVKEMNTELEKIDDVVGEWLSSEDSSDNKAKD